MTRHLAAALVGLAAVLGSAAGPAMAQTTLRIGLAEDPDVLDPSFGRTYVGRLVFASLCDKLFDIDDKLNVVPQLALSHETSPDGKTVTIKLRPGVKFHDGEPMDAEAVKYTLERHLTMPGSFRRPEIGAIDKVEVVDPLTAKLNLKAPYAPLIAQLTDRAGMMVSPKAAKAEGDKFGQKPVCAGPYRFVERVQQDRIVVERFPDYWDKDRVKIDRIVYLPIPDSTVRLANLKAGQLDLAERLLATDIKDIQADRRLKLATQTDLGYMGMTINVGNGDAAKGPLGQDPRLRRALSLAIDRAALNDVVFNGAATPRQPVGQPQEPLVPSQVPGPGARPHQSQGADRRPPAPRRRSPSTTWCPNNPETRQVAEVIQAMAAEAGFDMRIRVTEFATSLNEARIRALPGLHAELVGPDRPGRQPLRPSIGPGAPQNYSRSSDPQVDGWLDEARTASGNAGPHGDLREGGRQAPRRRANHLPLSPGDRDRAHDQARTGSKPVPDGLVRVVGLTLK